MTATAHEDSSTYDLVGVGFGPSNLALATAVDEHRVPAGGEPITARFLERQPRFGWHRGMLLDDATMQVSFLKDLVTQRDPSSRYSFLNYLHHRSRLVDFINHKTLFPLRAEFHDYLEWVAGQVADLVRYGREVVSVRPVRRGAEVVRFDVATDTGETYRARNVVLATGLRPALPQQRATTDRVWHSAELLHRLEVRAPDPATRFVVVGAGQSAAEVTAYLHSRFTGAEVCAVLTRYGYSPSDDSSFANRIFDPAAVDDFYGAPEQVKRNILDYHANTNYSVVDIELIDDLYRRQYREKVLGQQRLRVFNASRAAEVVEGADGVQVTVESMTSGRRTEIAADVLVYATGYRPQEPPLDELREHCCFDEQGRLRVERDYRVRTDAAVTGGIYLQGGATEHTHGMSSSLLSNNAVRSGEILGSIVARRGSGVRSHGDRALSGADPG